MCMCVLVALAPCKKRPAYDVRESFALHEKSRWLYPFLWYEQETRLTFGGGGGDVTILSPFWEEATRK